MNNISQNNDPSQKKKKNSLNSNENMEHAIYFPTPLEYYSHKFYTKIKTFPKELHSLVHSNYIKCVCVFFFASDLDLICVR